jgi:hypothetical protein
MSLESIYAHLGFLAELSSLIGALVCGYLMQVILRERTPLVQLQRYSLALLAIALVANGSFYYPAWALVEGHRPTGAFVDIAVLINLAVMAFRGHVIYQNWMGHHGEEEKPRQGISPSRG